MTIQQGECPQCRTSNNFNKVVCDFCGGRLPWADAIQHANRNVPSQISSSSPNPHVSRWLGTGIALLSIVGICIGIGYRSLSPKASTTPTTAPVAADPTSAPTPVIEMATVSPAPTSTPVAATPVDKSVQKRVELMERYLEQMKSIGGRIFDATSAINQHSSANDIVEAQATVQQGRVDFMGIYVPPPFVKTHALLSQAFAECELYLQLLELAVRMQHAPTVTKATSHLDNAIDMLDRADKDMDRIVADIRSQSN